MKKNKIKTMFKSVSKTTYFFVITFVVLATISFAGNQVGDPLTDADFAPGVPTGGDVWEIKYVDGIVLAIRDLENLFDWDGLDEIKINPEDVYVTNLMVDEDLTVDGISTFNGPVQGLFDSTILVRHSQTTTNPICPDPTWNQLWTGYSYLGSSIGGSRTAQVDLGKTGSCLKDFYPLMVFECRSPRYCEFNTGGDYSMWLSAVYVNAGSNDISDRTELKEDWISRCVVCEKSAPVVVVHSLANSAASCPGGWDELWSGYSYLESTPHDGVDLSSDLSNPGSCLETFVPQAFIECRSPTVCNYETDGDYTVWLTAGLTSPQGATDCGETPPFTACANKVSQCVVCTK